MNRTKMNKNWKPQENFIIEFDDKTGEERKPEELELMVSEMRMIANKYDFDLHRYGGQAAMKRKTSEEKIELEELVGEISLDLMGRGCIGDKYASCDREVRLEIKTFWKLVLVKAYKKGKEEMKEALLKLAEARLETIKEGSTVIIKTSWLLSPEFLQRTARESNIKFIILRDGVEFTQLNDEDLAKAGMKRIE